MTAIESAALPTARPTPTARWPLVAAPFVGLVYYLALLVAFRRAMGDVVADTSDLRDFTGLVWGRHWIYHTLAEAASVAFATFVAAGIGRERAQLAGLIGGFGISLWWTAWLAILVFLLSFNDYDLVGNPWYQWVISAITTVAAPVIGYCLGETAKEFSTEKAGGFAGIPRLHFLWLWFPTYWYAVAMIGPFLKYVSAYFLGYNGRELMALDSSVLTGVVYFIVCMMPLVAFTIPLFVGLGFISGELGNSGHGSKPMRPAIRQMLGTGVLVLGWFVGAAVQYGIVLTVRWLSGASD